MTAFLPVTVLTGFLGAGKTTLLNGLLAHPGLRDTAVIVNEFGEVGLDHLLVRRASEEIVLLNAGCLCCTVRGDMVTALRDLFLKRVKGEVPEFQRLVIETTGLADPAPILHTLMTDPLISAQYRLDGVVTVVDACLAAGQLDRQAEAVKQVAVADRLVLTKTDLVDPEDQDALTERLRALNPAAPILIAQHGALDYDLLLDCGLFSLDGKTADVARWLREEAYEAERGDDPAHRHHHHDHHHHHHHHDHDHDHDHEHDHHHDHDHHEHEEDHGHDRNRHDDHIGAFVLTYDKPLPWDAFVMAMDMLIASKGEGLLRVKGILDIQGQDKPIAVHGVQHIFHPPLALPAWPEGEPKRSRLVFITRDLTRDSVAGLLAATFESEILS